MLAKQILGKDIEAEILDQRTGKLKQFATDYGNILKNIQAMEKGSQPTIATTPTAPKSGSSSNSSSGSTSSSSSSKTTTTTTSKSPFATLKYTGDKSKLNKETSIIDRLKYFDFDSSNSARASYYKALGGSGTYSSTADQNVWLIKQMKAKGYASGTLSSDQEIANLFERGNELIIEPPTQGKLVALRDNSGVLPNNLTKSIFDVATNPLGYIKTALSEIIMPNNNTDKNSNSSIVNNFNITLPNVENGYQFVQELKLLTQNH